MGWFSPWFHGIFIGISWEFHLGVSINGGTPIAGWFMMENPTEMDDLGVSLFQETTIWIKHEISRGISRDF